MYTRIRIHNVYADAYSPLNAMLMVQSRMVLRTSSPTFQPLPASHFSGVFADCTLSHGTRFGWRRRVCVGGGGGGASRGHGGRPPSQAHQIRTAGLPQTALASFLERRTKIFDLNMKPGLIFGTLWTVVFGDINSGFAGAPPPPPQHPTVSHTAAHTSGIAAQQLPLHWSDPCFMSTGGGMPYT